MSEPLPKTTAIERLGFKDEDLKKAKHDTMLRWFDDRAGPVARAYLGESRSRGLSVERVRWQTPIESASKTIVGFVDAVVLVKAPAASPVGYTNSADGIRHVLFAFEIRAAVPSLGELLRQLEFYRRHLRPTTVLSVVADLPPDRIHFVTRQGFSVVHYPSSTLYRAGEPAVAILK